MFARFLCITLLAATFLAAPLTPAQPKPGRDYFPLEVGHKWEYRVGSRKLTVTATRQVAVGKVACLQLEAAGDGAKQVEVLGLQKDGVYRFSAEGQELKPPLCILKLPVKDGEIWKVEAVQEGVTIKGSFQLRAEEVLVPAGRYKAIVVHSDDLEIGTRQAKMTTWFAPGVGPVKQRLQIADVEIQLELEKFTPGQ